MYTNTILAQPNSELSDLEKTSPHNSQEKSTFESWKTSTVFPVQYATSAELQTLHRAAEEVKNQQSAVMDSIESQLTYMKGLDDEVTQNNRDIFRLVRTLKSLVYDERNSTP